MMQTLFMTVISVWLATAAMAAPMEESVGVDEGKCEVISVGFYFCKIGGKCYACGKNKDIDPKKDCFKEETCAAAMEQSGIKDRVTRPTRFTMLRSHDGTDYAQAVTSSVLCQRTE
jgi:hypothetical protein